MRRLLSAVLATATVLAVAPVPGARADSAPAAWPPPLGGASHGAFDFVHYGEGHHNQDGGPVTNGEIVRQANLYGAAFLGFSSDMATNGTRAELQSFEDYIEDGFSPLCPRATSSLPCSTPIAVPWFDSPGNHDREAIAGPGGVLSWTNAVWRDVFADNAWPWGDGPLPAGFAASPRDGDEPGASTHYWVDYGPVRLIALDNSCHSITTCDLLTRVEAAGGPAVGQHPAHLSQFTFLMDAANEASAQGKLVFVMAHEPTRDPRYPLNVAGISVNHTMNKGVTTDNLTLEAVAAAAGVDGMLFGHIKGNNVYEAFGVPAYIDGGGGGSPYTADASRVGVDWGAWYGYRIFRIAGGTVVGTWLVPLVDHFVLSAGGAPVTGPLTVASGTTLDLDAVAVQPRCTARTVCSNQLIGVEMRPPDPPDGFESSVPAPAYVWHSSNAAVLEPSGSRAEPGFDPASMSAEGVFRAAAPGTATVTIVSGWSSASVQVTVV